MGALRRQLWARLAAAIGMVLITVRAVVGARTLIKLARPIGDQETLDVTVSKVLESLDSFELASVQIFKDDAETPPATDIELGTMEQIKVVELAEIGRYLRLVGKEKEEPRARPLQNAFTELGKVVFVLPVKASIDRLDWHIYNALIDALDQRGLGFPKDQLDPSKAEPMLLALSLLLQYVIPFDDAGVLKVGKCLQRMRLAQLCAAQRDSRVAGEVVLFARALHEYLSQREGEGCVAGQHLAVSQGQAYRRQVANGEADRAQ